MSEDEFINYITQCGYVIDKLIVDGQAHQTSYQGYHFEFYEYGNVATACIGTELSVGTWDVTTVNDNLRFEIAIDDLPFINRNWIVHNFEETEVSFGLRLGEDILDFNMDCIDQTPDIIALLSSDTWTVYYLEVADINQTQTLSNYSFNFGDNDVVTAVNQETQEVEYGSWEVVNFGLELGLDFGSTPPLEYLNNEQWNIVFYSTNYIEVHTTTGDILAFEKE